MNSSSARIFFTVVFCAVLWSCVPTSMPSGEAADSKSEPAVLGSTDEFNSVASELGERSELPGAALFVENCALCHNGSVYKAPHTAWLEMMPARSLYRAMDGGVMAAQAAKLSVEQRIQVIEYLTQERFDGRKLASNHKMCSGKAAKFDLDAPAVTSGWGHDSSRFMPTETSQLAVKDIPRLKLKWAFGYPNATRARSQPTVSFGAIYVGSQDGTVYALDLETGCVRWAFEAAAEVRTGVVIDQSNADQPMAYFGDLIANVYGVNALTGEQVWSVLADDHPSATLTGTPALHDGRLYVPVSSLEVIPAADPDYECCTFRGKVLALDASDGTTVWESYSIPQQPAHVATTSAGTRVLSPSGAPVWTNPTIDVANNRLFFGTGENYSSPVDLDSDAIVAVRLDNGERLWRRQMTAGDAWNVGCMMGADHPNCPEEQGPDFDQGSSPLLIKDGEKQILVAGHKAGRVTGHNPDNGDELWSLTLGRGSIQGGVHFGMATDGERVYAPINDMNDTRNGEYLDPEKARPGISAVDPFSGELLWQHVQSDICGEARPLCDPGISAPVTAIPGAVFAGHLDGYVRAYEASSGDMLWEYPTRKEFDTVNGVKAKGGGMSGAGPTVVNGHLITNSGYGLYFHEEGNALLVFSVDGK